VNAGEFAAERHLDPHVLRSLCNYLVARRVLRGTETPGVYALDEDGAFLSGNELLRGWLQLVHGYEDVLHALPDLLAGRRRYAPGDVQRDGELVAVGSGRASIGFFFPLTVETIRRAGCRRVLDIGCGDARFLRHLCAQIPGIRAVGLDRSPEAVAAARERIAAENLSDRIEMICGDAFELDRYGDQLRGVDAATSFFVLHELCGGPDGGPLKPFLETYRRALPGVPLIAIEAIRPTIDEMRRRPGPAVEYTLLHDLSNQTTIGRGAWRQVLTAAGFTDIDEQHFDFARASIVTAK
jgi:SAM-dependent methyltransferase